MEQKHALTGKMLVIEIFYMSLTGILPVSQKVFPSMAGNLLVSDKFSKTQSLKRAFLQEIKINNHKPKSFLRLVEDPHEDSAVYRK